MECRSHCAACCVACTISSPIPGMPEGKPAGVACVQLDEDLRCKLFGKPERPQVCLSFMPHADVCGDSSQQAMAIITALELSTLPH